jgi:flagellar biosynthesis/type III secretory pathway M-ring protein FliF/YscJ
MKRNGIRRKIVLAMLTAACVPLGTLLIDVKESNFRAMVERYNTFNQGKVVIASGASRILYHTDSGQIGRPDDRPYRLEGLPDLY